MNNNNLIFSPSPYARNMQETSVLLKNGVVIHTEIGGNPEHPAIVLIMGLGGQVIHWSEAFCNAMIAQGFFIVRFDNRDIGLSSKTKPQKHKNILKQMIRFQVGLKNVGSNYTLETMADDTASLMQALNIEKYHVIGASMGGMIAQILAAKYPNNVEKLGLLFTSNNRPFLKLPHFNALKALLKRSNTTDQHKIIEQSVKLYQTIGSKKYLDPNELYSIAQNAYHRSYTPTGVLQQFLAILCTGSLVKWDKQIKQQTLVVHGQRDRLLPPQHGKAVAQSIKNAKFELIQEMGHDIATHFVPQLSALFGHHFKSY